MKVENERNIERNQFEDILIGFERAEEDETFLSSREIFRISTKNCINFLRGTEEGTKRNTERDTGEGTKNEKRKRFLISRTSSLPPRHF